ncbi:MAG: FKBP-type peptidyl-prolyl cis-trans isomerase [Nitrospiraceae bacterium]|nr:FKBP-type peptidyl-prolyl cis-trans isomerase [Nitrospiraceae bacterium]
MIVSKGAVVSVDYTLRLEDERVVDSTVGETPLMYTHGQDEILRGLEAGLDGMAKGATRVIVVSPSEGYGESHPEGFFEVQKARVPEDARRVGAKLEAKAPDGRAVFPYVAEIKSDTIVLDLNHPLAGKTLYFEVTVVDIRSAEEAARGAAV